jgi:hypothetical protein
MPVASTANALAWVGNAGAIFQVDVTLPTQQGNTNNFGQLQLLLNSRSRGISNVNIGSVNFSTFRPGIYNTMNFPIPPAIRTALGGAAFNDLTFQFLISSPGTGQGTYLFDNLRVHSVALVTAVAGTLPPPGYGRSVDLVVFGGGTPVAQSFDVGPVQVPDSFHLKLGTTVNTTVQLALGYDGNPAFTCTYGPDSSDPNWRTYIWLSCTGGFHPGDLVSANWAQLTILGGSASTQKLRAQLAKNPIGDQTGANILETMPTWWGDFDACAPATAAVPPSPPSTSCANQVAKASQIVTAYFNKVNNSNNPPNWIVTPTPEFAPRHADGTPFDTSTGAPPPNDPAFDESGSLNPGGSFDAGYHVWGNVSPNLDTSANPPHATLHAEANVSANLVLFGQNVEAAKLQWQINSDSGPIMPTSLPSPTATGELHCYILGSELQNNGPQNITAQGFTFNCHDSQESDFGSIDVWIFSIKFGPTIGYGLTTSGTVPPSGSGFSSLTVAPDLSLGVHIFGGVDVVVASGGVDAKVDLIDVMPSVTGGASWSLTTDPTACNATLTTSVPGTITVGSLGGEVDLVASFCVIFCHDESWKIFEWNPLASKTFSLFDYESTQVMPLPVFACKADLNVAITNPPNGATKRAGYPVSLNGSASDSFVTLNGFNISTSGDAVPCNNLSWMLTDTTDTGVSPIIGTGCNLSATFPQPLGSSAEWTINLSATDQYFGAVNGPITEIGLAAPQSITINALPQGVYIDALVVPCPGGQNCGTVYSFSDSPTRVVTNYISGPVQLRGSMVPSSSPPTCTLWTATDTSNSTTSNIATTDDSIPFSIVSWTPANPAGQYTVNMITDSGACVAGTSPTGTFGTNSVTVTFSFTH